MENQNILGIKNKSELIEKIEFMTSLGIYQAESMATTLMDYYVFGNNQRPLQNSPKSPKFPPRHLGDFS